jgi:RNA polymerase sigma-70 factor (ECF subfamily)
MSEGAMATDAQESARQAVQQLIQQAQQGDKAAVAQLYQMYAQQIFRYVAYRVPTQADAEDITGDVFIKMIEGLRTYRVTGAPFEAWLYRIAAARIADFHRRGRRRPQTELLETLSTSDPTPEEQIHEQQEVAYLRQAVSTLGSDQQSILVLRFIERKSHQEVAEILGKTVSAVKSIQHRALVQLAARLGTHSKVRHYLRGDDEQ